MSLAGKNIGRYRIIEQLGQGGMAVVYKAYDTRLEREVAIKLIRADDIPKSQHEIFLRRFEIEAKAQAKFDHSNIVPIHDFGEYEGAPYLVMAYRPGGTLAQMTGRPMPYPQAAGLLAPIADALAYAHAQDVIHRDIKPSNILLDPTGKPALTDFGIAKLLGDVDGGTLTGTGMGIGTPQYMAPEQWQGKPEKATDIYALGVVFYELITGRKPYDAETPAALAIIQATEPLPRPTDFISDLPEHVEQALYTALAPRPEDRYESMAAFEVVLKELSREEAQPAETPLAQTMVEELPVAPIQTEEEIAAPEPVVPTFYPKDDKTEAEIPPPKPPSPAAQFEEQTDFQPASKPPFKLPIWGWGLVGLVVLAGIIFGITQLGGSMPVAMEEETATEVDVLSLASTATEQPIDTLQPTNTVEPTVAFTTTPVSTPIGGGSGKIVFVSDRDGDMEIYMIDVDGSNLEKLTDNDVYDGEPAWSTDGTTISFSQVDSEGQCSLYTLDIERKIDLISDNQNCPLHSQWIGGNQNLYFNVALSKTRQKYPTGGGTRYVYPIIYALEYKHFDFESEDVFDEYIVLEEKYIGNDESVDLFYRIVSFDVNDENMIYTDGERITMMRLLDGYRQTVLYQSGADIDNLSFSPSGSSIAFTVTNQGERRIAVLEKSDSWNSNYSILSTKLVINNPLSWSPDGRYIAFVSEDNGNSDIWLMDADGSNLVQLTNDPSADYSPAWQPAASNAITFDTPSTTETPTSVLDIGSIITNPIDGASMAYIPAGEFEMNSGVYLAHTVYTDAFWMYQYEVTNDLYRQCVEAGVCELPSNSKYFDDGVDSQYPVVYVDWYHAQSYCEWAGGRLSTEAEWEKAARGGLEGMTYPWGNQAPTCTLGAENGGQYYACNGEIVPVGSFAPNGYGLYDMAGNAMEWVGDWFSVSYYLNSPYENPTGPTSGDSRVLRGGSWNKDDGSFRVALNYRTYPDQVSSSIGFRCAVPVE